MNIMTDRLRLQFDASTQSLLIKHDDELAHPTALIQIRASTLNEMNFADASRFIGERIILLMPGLSHVFEGRINQS